MTMTRLLGREIKHHLTHIVVDLINGLFFLGGDTVPLTVVLIQKNPAAHWAHWTQGNLAWNALKHNNWNGFKEKKILQHFPCIDSIILNPNMTMTTTFLESEIWERNPRSWCGPTNSRKYPIASIGEIPWSAIWIWKTHRYWYFHINHCRLPHLEDHSSS